MARRPRALESTRGLEARCGAAEMTVIPRLNRTQDHSISAIGSHVNRC